MAKNAQHRSRCVAFRLEGDERERASPPHDDLAIAPSDCGLRVTKFDAGIGSASSDAPALMGVVPHQAWQEAYQHHRLTDHNPSYHPTPPPLPPNSQTTHLTPVEPQG